MNNNGFVYSLNDDEEKSPYDDANQKPIMENEEVEYKFEGYSIEINTKVTLLPKALNSI